MKPFRTLKGAALFAIVLFLTPDAAPTRILFFGNSYTAFNEMPAIADSMASHCNPPIAMHSEMSIIYGGELSRHLLPENFRKIRIGGWTYVVLQGYEDPAYNPPEFYRAVRILNDSIRAAGAQTVLYETWIRNDLRSRYTTVLENSYDYISKELKIPCAPVVYAFEAMLASHPEIPMFDPDMQHPSPAASYLAAAVFIGTIFRQDPTTSTFTNGLSAAPAKILRQAAWSAVLTRTNLPTGAKGKNNRPGPVTEALARVKGPAISIASNERYSIQLFGADGKSLHTWRGKGPADISCARSGMSRGTYYALIQIHSGKSILPVVVP